MNPINYIIESSVSLLLFYTLYGLLFSKETFFNINRWYLVSTLIVSLVLPFITFPIIGANANALITQLPDFTTLATATESTTTAFTLQSIVWLIYGGGVIFFAARFLKALFQIYRLYQRGEKTQYANYQLVLINETCSPFSFFNYLFMTKSLELSVADKEKILQHEIAHIEGRHSLDTLLLEVLCILFWFHPVIHYYKRSLRNVHEYLADAAVLNHTSKRQYGQLLVQQTLGNVAFSITNNFNSQLKKRIVMMTKNPSNRIAMLKYASIVPLFLALLFTFSIQDVQAQTSSEETKGAMEVFQVVEKMPSFNGCEAGDKVCSNKKLIDFIIANLEYPKEARKQGKEGKIVVSFIIKKDGSIADAKVVKGGVGFGCEEEAIRVINAMPNWTPGTQRGKNVNVKMALPFVFALPKEGK